MYDQNANLDGITNEIFDANSRKEHRRPTQVVFNNQDMIDKADDIFDHIVSRDNLEQSFNSEVKLPAKDDDFITPKPRNNEPLDMYSKLK